MPTIQNSTHGQVVQIWGKAYIRGTDGVWRPLAVGEVVPQGTEILTEQNAIVMMSRGDVAVPKVAEATVERTIAALENNAAEDAPAAGLNGGGSGDLQPGLRIDRIVELVTPATIGTGLDGSAVEFGRATQSDPAATPIDALRLLAASSSIAAVEAGGSVNLGLAAPTGPGASSGALTITATAVPTIGQIFTADGTAVSAGMVLTTGELAGLIYRPPADYIAGTPVGDFGYSVSNGVDTANGGTQIAVTPVNDLPLAFDDSASGGEDILLSVSLTGSDIDGTVASVTVRTLPLNGTLLRSDTLTPVAVGQALTPAQAANLVFRPGANWNGSTSLTFTVTDNEGGVSAPATVQIQITPVNDPPTAVNDAASTVAQQPVTVAVLANDRDVDGDVINVTNASVSAALGSVVVNADGTLTFTAAPGITGPVAISYTISDGNGGTASATLTVNVAPLPTVTVDAPALTNDTTPTLVGTSNLPPGSTVTLTVTDANGTVQTFTTTVRANGTYTVDVPAPLAEGPYTAVANVSGPGGTSATATDNGLLDITPPAATLAIDPVTADNIVNGYEATANITLTGTVGGDVQVGDTVTLAINGVNYSGLVQAGNSFAISVPGAAVLADADRRIDGSVTTTDAAGNSATATAQRPYAVNSAPIAVNDTLSVGEDAASGSGDVTPGTAGQDRDADGDTLTVIGVAVGVLPSASGNVSAPLVGTWGTLMLDSLGAYTYVPSPAAQALDAGQTVSDTFTYTIDDGRGGSATATLTISVVGADDPTTISGLFIGNVTEDAVATASGALTNNDPDVGTRPFVAQSGSAGSYGTFSIDAAGNWSYTLSNAAANVQALAQGQSVTETFIVATDDGTTASITVTVDGANDAPVVSSTSINAVEEGAAVALGLALPSDIDNASVLTITVTGLPTIGQVQLADGTPVVNGALLTAAELSTLRYLPPTEYDGVAPVGTFAYSVSDGITAVNGGTTISVAAVNDPPAAFDDARSTGENSTLNANVPAATDVDGTVSGYTLASGVGAGNGSLAFNSDGSYAFATGTDFDSLAAGQSRQVTFTYTATDNGGAVSAPATVTITVTGANDAPTGADATLHDRRRRQPRLCRRRLRFCRCRCRRHAGRGAHRHPARRRHAGAQWRAGHCRSADRRCGPAQPRLRAAGRRQRRAVRELYLQRAGQRRPVRRRAEHDHV